MQKIAFGHTLFGYTTLIQEGDRLVALVGDGEEDLRIGMTVVLLGDSRGYVPSNFAPGAEVTIIGFTEPSKNGESDHIVRVTDGHREGRVKPSNIQRAGASSPDDGG